MMADHPIPVPNSICEHLYQRVRPIWDAYYDHPFVAGLGAGTLSPERFRFYMIQDYHYLLDYTKVFAVGLIKSDTEARMQQFAASIDSFLNGEMNIHRSYMKRLGIEDADWQQTPVALDNASYTAYMLNCAQTYGLPELMVSILSCSWSYAKIAAELLRRYPESADHPLYGEWIRGYTAADYLTSNSQVMAMTEAICRPVLQDASAVARLETIFETCSRYELAFWNMAYEMKL